MSTPHDAQSSFPRAQVEDLLFEEAALLDEWRLDEWLELFDEEARYVMPTTDLPEGRPGQDVLFIDDDMVKIRARVERLKSRFAHREYPVSRTRRMIGNVRVTGTKADERGRTLVLASANFVVYRIRREVAVYMGRYDYVLVATGEGLRIRHRKATLDLERLEEHGAVSIIV